MQWLPQVMLGFSSATAITSLCRRQNVSVGFASLNRDKAPSWPGVTLSPWAKHSSPELSLSVQRQQGPGAAAQLPVRWWHRIRGCTAKKPRHRPLGASLPAKICIGACCEMPSWVRAGGVNPLEVWAQRAPICLQKDGSGTRCVPFPQPPRSSFATLCWPPFNFVIPPAKRGWGRVLQCQSHQHAHRARPVWHLTFILCQGSC